MARMFRLVYREGGRLGDPPHPVLTNTQALALQILVSRGPLRLSTLAEEMHTTDATATRTVDALEAEGLVRRRAEPTDRRGVVAVTTSRGRTLHAARRRRLRQIVENLLEDRTEADLARIATFLEELNELLAPTVVRARSGVS
jgi:DNA-binding MarR family transcriptional regulator